MPAAWRPRASAARESVSAERGCGRFLPLPVADQRRRSRRVAALAESYSVFDLSTRENALQVAAQRRGVCVKVVGANQLG
jgi:hypothetical protein